ncbi:MAG: FecR family protein [Kiritimatiellae bacterium]|nr:FecR family protein [Kiritimatiellia bacterium]
MKKVSWLAGLLLSVAYFCAGARAEDPIGLVVALEGGVHAVSQDGIQRALSLQSPVYSYDRIVTGPGAKAQIMFDDDSVIVQGERSEMVVDDYIYNPSNKSDNKAFFKLIKGVFRAVTGKIVELNQEGFRVETGKAVIGIRGCEVLCRLGERKDEFFVTELTPGKTIFIQASGQPGGLVPGDGGSRGVNVMEPGTLVTVADGGRMEERPFSMEEIKGILNEVNAPAPSGEGNGDGGGADGGAGGAAADGGADGGAGGADGGRPGESSGEADGGDDSRQDSSLLPFADDPLRNDVDFFNDDIVPQSDKVEMPEPEPEPDPDPDPTPEPFPTPPDPTPDPDPTPRPTPLPTPTPIPYVKHEEDSGNNWSWGVWINPQDDKIAGTYSAGQALTPESVAAIAAGTVAYNLSGSGSSGALVIREDSTHYLRGYCTMDIQIGGPSPVDWNASFSLYDTDTASADTLYFNVLHGTLDADQRLSGTPTDIMLNSRGEYFTTADFPDRHVDGHLMGPGAVAPISGAAGNYELDSGQPEGPFVTGSYGANLDP